MYCDDPPLPQVLQQYGTIAAWWWWMSNGESTAYTAMMLLWCTAYTAMMLFNKLHVVSCCYRLHCTYTCKLHFSSSTLWSPQATTDNLRILWHIHYSEQGISCLNIWCHDKSELTAWAGPLPPVLPAALTSPQYIGARYLWTVESVY